MRDVSLILFATAFTAIVSLLLGKLLIGFLRIRLYRSEELFLGFVLGSAGLSTLVFLLTASHLAYTWMLFAAGCAIIALAWRRRATRFTTERLDPVPRNWMRLFLILYVPFALWYTIAALQPEASPDGNLYHVALPRLYLRIHHFPAITTNILADLSEGVEMLYLFAYAFGRHTAAAMVHLLFTLAVPWGILSYGRRIHKPVAGVVGGLLFFLSPTVALFGTMPYVDLALSAVVFSLFYVLQIWWEEQNNNLLIPAGILAGFAYGIKYTAGISVIYALGVIVVRLWRTPKAIFRPALQLCICAAILIAPWMIKNAIVIGNPIAPFGNRLFPNPYVYASLEADYREVMSSLRGMKRSEWPYEVTVRGARTQGALGPLFLLSPIALFALWNSSGRRVLAAAFIFLIPCVAVIDARFFLPSVTFISLALALALSRWPIVAAAFILIHAAGALPAVMQKYINPTSARLQKPDWRAALRITREGEFLTRQLDEYELGKLLEAKVARNERILSFAGIQRGYHSREIIVGWQSSLGIRMREVIFAVVNRGYFPNEEHQYMFQPVTARRVRLFLPVKTQGDDWSVSEFHVYLQGVEIPRAPEWRLRASPNNFDVQLAFDNSLLTRWCTRQPPRAGDFIEIDFGKPMQFDRVSASGLFSTGLRAALLQTENSPGQWQEIPRIDHEIGPIAIPPRIRRAAIEELERNNIQWLTVNDTDMGAHDLDLRQVQWGIESAGDANHFHLYHLLPSDTAPRQ